MTALENLASTIEVEASFKPAYESPMKVIDLTDKLPMGDADFQSTLTEVALEYGATRVTNLKVQAKFVPRIGLGVFLEAFDFPARTSRVIPVIFSPDKGCDFKFDPDPESEDTNIKAYTYNFATKRAGTYKLPLCFHPYR